MRKKEKEPTIDLKHIQYIIERWTDDEVCDSRADRDALEAVVAVLLGDGDTARAANVIRSWRRKAIEKRQDAGTGLI